ERPLLAESVPDRVRILVDLEVVRVVVDVGIGRCHASPGGPAPIEFARWRLSDVQQDANIVDSVGGAPADRRDAADHSMMSTSKRSPSSGTFMYGVLMSRFAE